MEDSLLWKLVAGLFTVLLAVLGFSVKTHKSDHDKLKDSHNALALKVSESYALKTDLNAARRETSESLKRVYDKIEAVDESLDKKISDIPDRVIRLLRREAP